MLASEAVTTLFDFIIKNSLIMNKYSYIMHKYGIVAVMYREFRHACLIFDCNDAGFCVIYVGRSSAYDCIAHKNRMNKGAA